MKKEKLKQFRRKIKEPILLSKCCDAEVDFQGGGYIDEDVAPVIEVCKKCENKCDIKRITPIGWIEPELPF